MGLNRAFIGKSYPPQDYGVTAEAIINYARAYNEDSPWFCDAARPVGIIAPPMFGVVMSWVSIMNIVADSDLRVDLLRLLHSEQDMRFDRPVAPGDIITSVAKVATIEEQPGGESLTVAVDCVNQRSETVQHILFTALIRGKGSREQRRGRRSEDSVPTGDPLVRVQQTIDSDQTYRYAQASGDHNPIHVDENVAKMAGLPGIIVHGLCTMAFTSKVMIDGLCDGDPRRLKRLRACFSRPVFPGQQITTAVWSAPERHDHPAHSVYMYETYGPEGKVVIKKGIAEVAE
jgi:acyl dehydratase